MPQSSLIFRGPPFMGRGGCVRVVRLLAGISISFLFTSLRLCSFVDLFDCPPGIMEGDGKGQKPRLLNTQTTASYIPEPREMLESISRATRMQRQQNGMQDNGMECKTGQDQCSVRSVSISNTLPLSGFSASPTRLSSTFLYIATRRRLPNLPH